MSGTLSPSLLSDFSKCFLQTLSENIQLGHTFEKRKKKKENPFMSKSISALVHASFDLLW